jgi:GNAT superfamily N-acetyltransferase
VPELLPDVCGVSLAIAVEVNPAGWFRSLLPAIPVAVVVDTDEYLRFETGLPSPLFNGFMRPRLQPERAALMVRDLVESFKARSLPLSCWIGPASRPVDLSEHLLANGMEALPETPCMAMELDLLEDGLVGPPELEVAEALTTADMDDWMVPVAAGFRMPSEITRVIRDALCTFGLGPGSTIRHFIGRLDDLPVGCATTFYGAGVAGVYTVATVPEARRRGVAASVVTAALRAAREVGQTVSILHPSAMGYGVYERMGFRECCRMRMYTWMPPSPP